MNHETDVNPPTTPSSQPEKRRLPYHKPVLRHEGVFETMALACGKISSTQGQCRSNIKNS